MDSRTSENFEGDIVSKQVDLQQGDMKFNIKGTGTGSISFKDMDPKIKGTGSISNKQMDPKIKGTGSISSKEMIFRADKIDLKNIDIQLEKHLSRVWSKNIERTRPKEEWEIDLSKLDIRYVVARGTYGIVYRGTYDERDVAGNH